MTFTASLIQYLRPDRRQKAVTTELPIEAKSAYDSMIAVGCHLEAEVLLTGEVSCTIFDPRVDDDIDVSLTQNGSEVQAGLVSLLNRRAWERLNGEISNA